MAMPRLHTCSRDWVARRPPLSKIEPVRSHITYTSLADPLAHLAKAFEDANPGRPAKIEHDMLLLYGPATTHGSEFTMQGRGHIQLLVTKLST